MANTFPSESAPSMLARPKLVIFDLDGTLVDSAADIQVAANHTFSALELPQQPLEQIKRWIGGGAQVFVEKAMEHFGKVDWYDRSYELFMDFYRAVPAERTIMFEGAKELVEYLAQQQILMAVVSNKPHELILPILEHLDIAHHFELVLGGDSLALKKPDPAPLLHVCQELDISAENCWMVGDSAKDADAAENAEMPFVGVTYGYALFETDIRPQLIPHTVVDNLKQLIPMIDQEHSVYA
jgi:phosphoglycolate phosphatase